MTATFQAAVFVVCPVHRLGRFAPFSLCCRIGGFQPPFFVVGLQPTMVGWLRHTGLRSFHELHPVLSCGRLTACAAGEGNFPDGLSFQTDGLSF